MNANSPQRHRDTEGRKLGYWRLAIGYCLCTAGCSTTNLAKILHELKADPATVEFQVMAPGWAVSFKRAFPTNLVVRVPPSTLQYSPLYVAPGVPPLPPVPFDDPLR